MKKIFLTLTIASFIVVNIIKEKSNTPVILLTAMGETENKIKGLKTGADDYISKPFEPEELYLRIENLLKLFKCSSAASLLE